MIDPNWLTDRLCDVLRWQVANPGLGLDHEDHPEMPWAGRRVWGLFLEMHSMRAVGMGPTPLRMEDFDAHRRVTGETVRVWEYEMIRALDAAWLKAVSPQEPEREQMTKEKFDGMFGGGRAKAAMPGPSAA